MTSGEIIGDSTSVPKALTGAEQKETSRYRQGFSLDRFIERIKDIKELLAFAAILGGACVWVVNYFATADQLAELSCSTKLNVRLLSSSTNLNHTQELAKEGMSEYRDQERLLDEAKKGGHTQDAIAIQNRMDDLQAQTASFRTTIDDQEREGKKALVDLPRFSGRVSVLVD